MKKSEIEKRLGWLPDLPDQRDNFFHAEARKIKKLPEIVDLEASVAPVVNQSSLGSCVGNGIAGVHLSAQIKQQLHVPFFPSRLAIYYGARELEGTTKYDSGAFIRDGIKVIARNGAAPEKLWPYKISKFTTKPSAEYYKEALKHQAIKYERVVNNVGQIQASLAEGVPVVFGFTVYESFYNVGRSGVVPMPKSSERILGGHCVYYIGYNNKTRRLKFRNSWSEDWGDDGDGYHSYDYLPLCDDFWRVLILED